MYKSIQALLAVIVVAGTVVASSPANAQVATAGGALTILGAAPASVQQNVLQSDTAAFGFWETKANVLSVDFKYDVSTPGLIDQSSDIPVLPITMHAGDSFSSFFIHVDSLTASAAPGGARVFNGSVTFDLPIIGLIVNGSRLVASDALAGAPGTAYQPTGTGRAPEFLPADTDTVNWSGNTVTFHFVTFAPTMDEIRILVSVPEPGSVALMSCMGIAGVGFFWKRRKFMKRKR